MAGVGSVLPAAVLFRGRELLVLDQRLLPFQERYIALKTARAVAGALSRLQIRGAPWIGVAAGYGLALEAQRLKDLHLVSGLKRAGEVLIAARPTAVNLSWAVKQIMELVEQSSLKPQALRRAIVRKARAMEREERQRSLTIVRNGARVVPAAARILTICNTGALAGPGMGTALGVILQAHLEGKRPLVYVCETRPLLQGARLTVWELMKAGVGFKLIVDSAAASVIEHCDLVLVGADRIARNGDTANKVGTKMLAVLARDAQKPFYVVAPSSTFDRQIETGAEIIIEERAGDEVRRCRNCRIAPAGAPVLNPAFDITPAGYITGFITEAGMTRPPFSSGIRRQLYSVEAKTRSITTGGRT